ncbi:MAG TPA: class I SAM-dependent methyltransferase [Terracidiphilus sp.]|jgi:methyltransferase (TIGR00027 family)
MEAGTPSKTALRVALRRAVHQLLDWPPVLDDPIAVPLLGSHFQYDRVREMEPVARAFRAFMAVRSRYAEDRLAESVANGVTQYVVLGAGLDTFACRNPFPRLKVFEVDFPATQQWKRTLLSEAAIRTPEGLTFVALDFEHRTLTEGLAMAGFDFAEPAFFGWLGVVPYLTLEAFRSTLEAIARLREGTGVSFDYGVSPAMLGPLHRLAFDALAARVAKAGEPFRLFFTPDELDSEFRRAGFRWFEQGGADELNALYFADRADGLKLPSPGLGRMATARV